MYVYNLRAELDNSITSIPIPARNDQCAIAIAAKEIAARYPGDKRISKGKVTLVNQKGEAVMVIPEEGKEQESE